MRWANKRHRLLARWTTISVVVLLGVGVWAFLSREPGEAAVMPGERVEGLTAVLERSASTHECPIRFEDVTNTSGIEFRHFPANRASALPEDMGSGVAAGDYDNDGRVDLFFVNFATTVLEPISSAGPEGRCRLYRNLGDMRFEDVTDRSGLGLIAFGMGSAWGDYDGDGDLDLYVTAYGDNVLYNNDGDGTFTDVTEAAGVSDARFSSGCTWADYDRDGDLDLYVCNYVSFVFREQDRGVAKAQYSTEQPYTLNPSAYPAQPNALFRNRGDGTFEEVAEAAGVADPQGRSLGAVWTDLDNDGYADLYVANDVSNNGVFHNRGDGTFQDIGPQSLAADYRGAMGIAAADFDNDLDQDLVITHWIAQENALYRNMLLDAKVGPSTADVVWFMDAADTCGLGQIALDMVGWATGFADFDNDGLDDLWLINGSTLEQTSDHSHLVPQRPFVFWNRGNDQYDNVADRVGPAMQERFVGRGGVQADMDGDGLLDLVLVVHGASPMILRNVSTPTGHWLGVRLRQSGGNTHAIGARAYATVGGRVRMAESGSGPSYLSQHEETLRFGLGASEKVEELRIVWPDGTEETYRGVAGDQVVEFARTAG